AAACTMNEDTEDTVRLATPRSEEPPATVDLHPLAGLHAVVTGGSRGIGFAVAKALAGLGASLTLLGRDRERLYSAISELPGATCDTQVCAVGDEGAVARATAARSRSSSTMRAPRAARNSAAPTACCGRTCCAST